MSTRHSIGSDADGPPLVLRQAVEALTYAGLLTAIAFVLTAAVGVGLATSYGCSFARGLVIGKQFLFFGGFAVLAYGAFRLRPKSPRSRNDSLGSRFSGGFGGFGGGMGRDEGRDDDEDDHETSPQSQRARDKPHPDIDESGGDGGDETGFQRFVQTVPPMRFFELAPNDRAPVGAKVLLSGFFMLLVTFVMEYGFGLYNVPC